METSLLGKVVLITGGARRVGAAICRRLHRHGALLVVHCRSSMNEARLLQEELNHARPDSVAVVRADLLNLEALPALVSEAVQRFGKLDALINNASSFYPTPVGEITETAWNDLLGTNLKAPLFLSQAAAPALKLARGTIVNIVDIHAARPMKNHVVYSIAKAGLMALTQSLARELAPEVRVNGVAPGPILWPEDGRWADEKARRQIIDQTLLKRVGEPDDIAKAVRFLIADAPYVTGQVIAIDGGRSANF